jgi:hypothetical protein
MTSKVQESDPILWPQSNMVSLCQLLNDEYVMDYLADNGGVESVIGSSLMDCIAKATAEKQ